MAEKQTKEWKNDDLSMQRGDYGSSFLIKTLFVLGRLATGPIQYWIIMRHPLQRFGIPAPPSGGFVNIGGTELARFPLIIAAMPGVLSIKHALWVSTYMNERMTGSFAFFGITADIIYESITSLVFTAASANSLWSEQLLYVGSTLYFAGVALELVAELQRVAFKSKPENKGKLCTTGFWAITRHINYTANVIFGFGYGLASGGPLYTPLTAGMYLSNFITNAIPSIEEYCSQKYGEAWKQYEAKVPTRLIPGIY